MARGDYPASYSQLQEFVFRVRFATAMLDVAIAHFGRRGVLWWPHIPANRSLLSRLCGNTFRRIKCTFVEDRRGCSQSCASTDAISPQLKKSGDRVTASTFADSGSSPV